MRNLSGKTVLITGGASGIGRIMGELVLKRGARLIIWDINQERTDQVVIDLSRFGKVSGYQVDVADQHKVSSLAEKVRTGHGDIDVLINNAGIIVGKYFHEHTPQDIRRTMDINASAPMYITREFLPGMLRRNSGHICNIASSAGLVSNPRMAVYVASKWAVTGWSDSLRLEMKKLGKNIGVTTVTPYYIDTGMFTGVRSLVPILKPAKVARRIIRAIERDRIFVSMPWSVHFVRFSQGILPVFLFDWVMGSVLGIYKTMDHFQGRS